MFNLLSMLGLDTTGRYVARTIYRYVWLVLVSLTGLFFVFDIMAELADVGKAAYTLRLAAIYAVFQIPTHMYDIMPIATVAGAIVALAALANNSEITVLRSAGFTPRQLMRTLFLIGIPLVVLTLLIGEGVQPIADQRAAQLRMQAIGYSTGGELRSGIWLREVQADGGVQYLNIQSVSPQGEAQQLQLWVFDAQSRLTLTVAAPLGVYTVQAAAESAKPNGFWRFVGAKVQAIDPITGRNAASNRSGASGSGSAAWDWHTTLSPSSLAGMQKLPERLHMVPLVQNILFLVKNNVDARKPISVLLRRLVHPFALWVMLALAMPFAYVRARGGAVAARVLAGVFMGIGFHTGNNLFQFLGLVQGWPVWLSAQMPVWIGLALAMLLFWRFHRLH